MDVQEFPGQKKWEDMLRTGESTWKGPVMGLELDIKYLVGSIEKMCLCAGKGGE